MLQFSMRTSATHARQSTGRPCNLRAQAYAAGAGLPAQVARGVAARVAQVHGHACRRAHLHAAARRLARQRGGACGGVGRAGPHAHGRKHPANQRLLAAAAQRQGVLAGGARDKRNLGAPAGELGHGGCHGRRSLPCDCERGLAGAGRERVAEGVGARNAYAPGRARHDRRVSRPHAALLRVRWARPVRV